MDRGSHSCIGTRLSTNLAFLITGFTILGVACISCAFGVHGDLSSTTYSSPPNPNHSENQTFTYNLRGENPGPAQTGSSAHSPNMRSVLAKMLGHNLLYLLSLLAGSCRSLRMQLEHPPISASEWDHTSLGLLLTASVSACVYVCILHKSLSARSSPASRLLHAVET